MADEGYPPAPSDESSATPDVRQAYPAPPRSTAVPPAAGYVYASVPPVQSPDERPRSKAWMWWTFGMLALVALMVTSCMLPFIISSGDLDLSASGDAVAVIRLDGIIAGTGDVYSGYVTPESFLDQLDMAVEDSSVKAIVLRVDSPGGTVAASEEIAAYVKECEKPVVVSVGDIGASGAYMVASQAEHIFVNPGSSVGSIGVIAEIPNVSALLGKVGVEFQVITAGKNKDTGSPYRPLTKEERALIQGEVDEAYEQFIEIVSEGRDLSPAQVRRMATGWTWSGEKAIKMGLADEIGTYSDALDDAAERGNIEGDYEVITYDEEFGELFGSLLGIQKSLARLTAPGVAKEEAVRRAVPR